MVYLCVCIPKHKKVHCQSAHTLKWYICVYVYQNIKTIVHCQSAQILEWYIYLFIYSTVALCSCLFELGQHWQYLYGAWSRLSMLLARQTVCMVTSRLVLCIPVCTRGHGRVPFVSTVGRLSKSIERRPRMRENKSSAPGWVKQWLIKLLVSLPSLALSISRIGQRPVSSVSG